MDFLRRLFGRQTAPPKRLGLAVAAVVPAQLDPEAMYEVDYRIEGREPLYVFGLTNDDRVRDATITLQQLESWRLPGASVGIFENQTDIGRKVLARFSDHIGRQFSSLTGNEERIAGYIQAYMN